jgi:hypothetical protein
VAHENEIVGASGRSPVSDFRLPSAGDLPVALTTSAIFETAKGRTDWSNWQVFGAEARKIESRLWQFCWSQQQVGMQP